eukprot:460101-Pelagomonas_calceolata.AAC.1
MTLELRVMNAQMPLPNTRLFRVMTPLQTQPSPVQSLKAILSMTPPGLPLRKLHPCKYIRTPQLTYPTACTLHSPPWCSEDALAFMPHKLGKSKNETGYYSYYQILIGVAGTIYNEYTIKPL